MFIAERIDDRPASGLAFTFAVLFAIWIAPFVGGIRGPAVYAGWLLFPFLAHRESLLARVRIAHLRTRLPQAAASAAGGALVGLALLALRPIWPSLLAFVRVLPTLHRDMVGGSPLILMALVPAGHVVHELFYRDLLQRELEDRLGSGPQAILMAGLLFSWTHVFVFQQLGLAPHEYVGLMAFTWIESLVAGSIFARTRSVTAAVAFRAANLLVVMFALLVIPG